MAVLALEDAAREAANTIFSLRRHRIELITGEAGENVFGEGLKAALAEIERLEQSYLELFLGKRVVTTETRRYVVYPQSDKKQYIVCRFSAARLTAQGAVALLAAVAAQNEENRQAVLRAAGSLGKLPAEDYVHEELAWRLEA